MVVVVFLLLFPSLIFFSYEAAVILLFLLESIFDKKKTDHSTHLVLYGFSIAHLFANVFPRFQLLFLSRPLK